MIFFVHQFRATIARLSIAAKLTHARYGVRKLAANFEISLNFSLVSKIAIHKITISKSAANGFLNPKNIADHNTFSNSCTQNNFSARCGLFFAGGFTRTRYQAAPINTYSSVQTGPNSQFGGLKNGLFRLTYQVFTDPAVNQPPAAPAPRHIAMHKNNSRHFIFIYFSILNP